MNFYEFFNIKAFQESSKASSNSVVDCFPLPPWVLATTSISLVLITSNASANFFIYSFVNTAFREELSRYWKTFIRRLGLDKAYNMAFSWHKNKPEVVVLEGDNISSIGHIQMTNREITIGTDIRNSSIDYLDTVKETSHRHSTLFENAQLFEENNIEPVIELEYKGPLYDSEEIKNGTGKIYTNGTNDEAIDAEELQPLTVATISVNGDTDRVIESKKITKTQKTQTQKSPETVVKIYCDYEAVRV